MILTKYCKKMYLNLLNQVNTQRYIYPSLCICTWNWIITKIYMWARIKGEGELFEIKVDYSFTPEFSGTTKNSDDRLTLTAHTRTKRRCPRPTRVDHREICKTPRGREADFLHRPRFVMEPIFNILIYRLSSVECFNAINPRQDTVLFLLSIDLTHCLLTKYNYECIQHNECICSQAGSVGLTCRNELVPRNSNSLLFSLFWLYKQGIAI